jgi:hypothetical protein
MFFVNVMTMSMGNVNDAPVRLNALMLENARVYGLKMKKLEVHILTIVCLLGLWNVEVFIAQFTLLFLSPNASTWKMPCSPPIR